ncbi:EAL domain-containing protein [Roseomonas sp. CAU 1739]|uniref:putative bifunctional diguanylate cyclase/phosphodiesterase n=1 Tax=Roseomonas sp. CAU 1739 TaxID=3140364 RepID=UPI00325B38C7
MAMSGRWPRSTIPLIGAFLAALVFVASLAISARQLSSHAALQAAEHRVGVWESSQALLEAARLGTEIERLAAGRPGAARAVTLRYEILWSRLVSLQEGDGERHRSPTLLAVRAGLPAFFEILARAESVAAEHLGGDPTAISRGQEAVGTLALRLGEANRALQHDQRLGAEEAAEGLRRLHGAFAVSLVGLITSATVLTALLYLLWRRASGALHHAEAAQARAGRSEQLLRVVVDALPVMVSAHDRQGRFVLANAALARFHRTSEAALLGRGITEVTGAEEEGADIAAALAGGTQLPFREETAIGPDGAPRTLLITAAPVADPGAPASAVVRIGLDISRRKEAEEQIRYMAEHDSLTGLANRLLFTRRLNHALVAGGMVALHLIDLDDFKDVNDTMGHAAGDALLMAATSRMRACLKPGDMLARLGGDEFAVVQVGIAGVKEADAAAARIVRALGAPYAIDGASVPAGASVGIAIGPGDGVDGPTMLQRADIALYRAKAAGRGQVRRFSTAMAAALMDQKRLESDVQQALERGELHFAYQPKFRLSDLTFSGCEALLRWTHGTRGNIPPGVFVPAAERAGLSVRLARYTLEIALRQQRAWEAEGLDIPVAVNLSARHIVSGQAPELLRDALAATGCRADRIEIEVTEDVFIRDPEAAAATLAKLREIGVKLALDDFGTGYASLGYLQQLPFDVIKLDRSFVAGLGASTRTERIVDAVSRIAHGLGARLVAEGVESAVQLARLRDIGCDEGQGYLLGRPMAPEALVRLPMPSAARHDGAEPTLIPAA